MHYATALEESHPEAAAMLGNVKLTTDLVSGMTYALVVEKANADDFAKQWVMDNSELVDSWMK